MKLIILGKSSDDKGSQLEKLTGTLLKKLGYSNVIFNEVTAGADEKDVTAEYAQPTIGSPIVYKVIIECKAYNKPINLPDWLKFLGKLFATELEGNQVQGCFIALSGANGNVMGHYNLVHAKRKEIKLLTGDDLITALQSPYKLKQVDEIINVITAQTDKRIINIELCYYKDFIYWIVSFRDNAYTLLSNDGKAIDKNEAKTLHDLIITETDLLTYVDLQAENETLDRVFQFMKFVTAIFVDVAKPMRLTEILEICQSKFGVTIGSVTKEDIDLALRNLLKNNLILQEEDIYYLVANQVGRSKEDLLNLYRVIVSKDIKLMALESEFYQSNINLDLFEAVIELHNDIQIPTEKIDQLLRILRWSPSALNYAINIDHYLHEHRSKQMDLTEVLQDADTTHFIREIYKSFIQDFQNPGFTSYLYKTCDIAELEIILSAKIKNKKQVISEHTTTQRLGIFELDNGGLKTPILIDILKNQPELWAMDNLHEDTIPPTIKNTTKRTKKNG